MKGIHNPFRKRKTNQNEDLFGDDWVTPNQSMEGIPDQQPTLAEKELAVALKNQAKNAKLFPWLGSVVFGALSILSVAGSVITFGSLVSLDEVCPLVNSGCGQFNRSGLAWFLWFQTVLCCSMAVGDSADDLIGRIRSPVNRKDHFVLSKPDLAQSAMYGE
ncbi:hypothetical protein SARC_01065 [Sphaeroforma arctica JP610]|uniref:Uncharacterized protein n=1 Tax=Sphaeroforma arctica JP610 TaxID=667725 RepID=A0A0L0GEU7_9EUKA|nr:hypothetical protein SARC_01065 [Sphaeroforma arctica JP610]KNC86803.1 hypothetical protein SARC_01065 [Sphaeroforma arctica JP610]|eukprot:XP_014160705.1 hypothetical protein SARC_01065 [Sphaeroforma arctica JP610]